MGVKKKRAKKNGGKATTKTTAKKAAKKKSNAIGPAKGKLTVESIGSLTRAAELLDRRLDFALCRAEKKAKWFALASGEPYESIAGDAAGGQFVLYGRGSPESLPLLYVSSEGQAGRIADDLTQGIQLMVAMPYWRDLLKFSGRGKLTEMRKAARFCEQGLREDEPDIDTVRREISRALRLTTMDDPIKALHKSVKASEKTCRVVSPDGREFESLFNSFVVRDNRSWNR